MRVWQVHCIKLWRWPHHHPTESVLLTSLYALVLLIVGIGAMFGAGSVEGGLAVLVILIVPSLGLLGLTVYAGYRTEGFKCSRVPTDTAPGDSIALRERVQGHALVRWIGPMGLLVGYLSAFVFVGLTVLFFTIAGWVARLASD